MRPRRAPIARPPAAAPCELRIVGLQEPEGDKIVMMDRLVRAVVDGGDPSDGAIVLPGQERLDVRVLVERIFFG